MSKGSDEDEGEKVRTMAKKVRTTMTAIIKTNSDEDPAKIRLSIKIGHISETILLIL